MARWDDVLTRADAEAIHAYLVDQAWQASTAQPASRSNQAWILEMATLSLSLEEIVERATRALVRTVVTAERDGIVKTTR